MKQPGQKLLCVHRGDEGAQCHITESAHLCLVKTGMCTLDGAHMYSQGGASLSRLKSQPGPIDRQTEQAQMKELQRSCTQSKGRSTAHGQTEKPCTFYRQGKPCTMPQHWIQVKNQTLY